MRTAPGVETLGREVAMRFPLIGSATLFSLYLAFKFLDPATVNIIIAVYFCLIGCAALTATFAPLVHLVTPAKLREITYV